MTFGALGGFLRTPKNPAGYGPAVGHKKSQLIFVCNFVKNQQILMQFSI